MGVHFQLPTTSLMFKYVLWTLTTIQTLFASSILWNIAVLTFPRVFLTNQDMKGMFIFTGIAMALDALLRVVACLFLLLSIATIQLLKVYLRQRQTNKDSSTRDMSRWITVGWPPGIVLKAVVGLGVLLLTSPRVLGSGS